MRSDESRCGDVGDFVNELTNAALHLGRLSARLDSCRFVGATIPDALERSLAEKPTEAIVQTLFEHPVLTSRALSRRLDVTVGQAKRYLEALEERRILSGSDRRRNRLYCFTELLDAMRLC